MSMCCVQYNCLSYSNFAIISHGNQKYVESINIQRFVIMFCVIWSGSTSIPFIFGPWYNVLVGKFVAEVN